MEIRKQFRLEAAHHLPHHDGKCARPHGHSYKIDIAVRGQLIQDGPQRGMVLDFDLLSRQVKTLVVDRLDHTDLNDIIANPTAEELTIWIWRELEQHLAGLHEVVVWETETACAIKRAGGAV